MRVSASSNCARPKSSRRETHLGAVLDEHVGRLHVAVHDPVPVRVRQRVEHLRRDLDGVTVGQLPGAEELAQRAARHVLVGDVHMPVVAARSRMPGRSARAAAGRRLPSPASPWRPACPRGGRSSARSRGPCARRVPARPSPIHRARAAAGAGSGRARARGPGGRRPQSTRRRTFAAGRSRPPRTDRSRTLDNPAGACVSVHDDDILDFDFVDEDDPGAIASPGRRQPGPRR